MRKRRVTVAVFLLIAASLLSFGYLALFHIPGAPVAEARHECLARLHAIYKTLRFRMRDGKALPTYVPRTAETPEVLPIDTGALGLENAYCPIISYLTNGKERSPFLLVYAVKKRATGQWERISLNSGEPVPLVFVSESFGQQYEFGEGFICFSDGSAHAGVLPLMCWPITHDSLTTMEITIPEGDVRFPYGRDVAAIKVQEILSAD